jgi:hypothetical protein
MKSPARKPCGVSISIFSDDVGALALMFARAIAPAEVEEEHEFSIGRYGGGEVGMDAMKRSGAGTIHR